MAFDRDFIIQTVWTAANSAYLIENVASPPLPGGFALVGEIDADPNQAAAAAAAIDPTQRIMSHVMLVESNIFGLVAFNAATSTAIVAFRGTQDATDWIHDVDAIPVDYIAVPKTGLVHAGFQLVYEHVRQSVAALLQKCQGVKNILITGHSLGGAVAMLSAFDIAVNITPGITPSLCTLAGPRAADPGFRDKFNAKFPDFTRVVNFMDVVPQVPLPPLYEHAGVELAVNGGFKAFDLVFAHRLTTYLAGLQKLPAPPPQQSVTSA